MEKHGKVELISIRSLLSCSSTLDRQLYMSDTEDLGLSTAVTFIFIPSSCNLTDRITNERRTEVEGTTSEEDG